MDIKRVGFSLYGNVEDYLKRLSHSCRIFRSLFVFVKLSLYNRKRSTLFMSMKIEKYILNELKYSSVEILLFFSSNNN